VGVGGGGKVRAGHARQSRRWPDAGEIMIMRCR